MHRTPARLFAASLFAAAALAAAPVGANCLVPDGEAGVVAVTPAAALALDDGRTLRLADVRPADAAMRPALEALVGRRVAVALVEGGARDRWGQVAGDATPVGASDAALKDTSDAALKDTEHGLRVAMLARGLALVDPVGTSGACLAELFGVERTAEADRRGVWQAPPVVSATADGLTQAPGRYVLVDGTVASVGETRETLYLDFGSDWRTDFTVTIRRRDALQWGFDARALLRKRVRVRGVLEAWNGGLIRIEHPAQVERLLRR